MPDAEERLPGEKSVGVLAGGAEKRSAVSPDTHLVGSLLKSAGNKRINNRVKFGSVSPFSKCQ